MKRIRRGKALEISGISILPVEQIVIAGDCCPHGIALSVEYMPIGIILEDGEKQWAIGIDGKSVDPEELIKKISD